MSQHHFLPASSILLTSLLLSACGSDDQADSLPVYESINASALTPLNYSDFISTDLDGDKDIDLVQCGYDPVGSTSRTQIYINNEGTFELLSTPLDSNNNGEGDTALPGLNYECALDFADMDNDGDIDIVGTGAGGVAPDYGVFTYLFENQGDLTFTTKTQWVRNSIGELSDLPGTNQGFVTFADINNDKYFEIMLSASTDQNNLSKLFLNNTDGTFSVIENPVDGTSVLLNKNNGTHAWGDFNNDQYQDLIIIGGQSDASIHLYKNNQDNTFSKIDNPVNGSTEFPGLFTGPISWGDIDGDHDLDILISATYSVSYDADTLIYENLGRDNSFNFSLVENPVDTNDDGTGDSAFTEHGLSEMFLADIDVKNQLDIILVGTNNNNSEHTTSIYLNTGDKSYQKIQNPVDSNGDEIGDTDFELVSYAGATVADLDNDGDNELIYNGINHPNTVTAIYENINGNTFVKVSEPAQ